MSASTDFSRRQQETTYTDQRLAAAEGGMAAGAYGNNSRVNVSVVDGSDLALAGMRDTALGAFGLSANVVETVADIVGNQANRSTQLAQDTITANAGLVSAIQELGQVTATGGQSDMNKTLLYLGLGLFAAMAIAFWRK